MTITPSKWLLASKLLGRDVPTSEPYPCLREETGYRNCACDGCNPRPVTPPAEGGLPDEEFAKLLAAVASPPCDGPIWFGTPCDDSRVQPAKSGNPAQAPINLCDRHVSEYRNAVKHEDEDLVDAVRRICRAYSDSFARAQQKQIGLSEIGDPCDRAVAYRLFEMPAVNVERDRHLADVGTAWHSWVAEAFAAENRRLGRERYLIEQRVWLTDGYSGTCDLYDTDTARVIDHKLLGVTSMRKIRNGDIPEKYRVQLHSYGLGHVRAGRPVREVALVCFPRSDNLGGDFGGLGLYVHAEPYDERIALNGLDRLGRLSALLHQLDPEQHPDRWALIPATPGGDCRWCPFFRPGGPADATGCPGQPVSVPTSMPGIV